MIVLLLYKWRKFLFGYQKINKFLLYMAHKFYWLVAKENDHFI